MKPGDLVAGRFVIERVAVTGGMGTVYRAREGGAVVALKVLHGAHPDDFDRFSREAELLEALDSPNVVRYVASGQLPDGMPFFAMEWLEGKTLAERLAGAPLSSADTVDLGIRIADVLATLHTGGLVHRDLKPSNIFLIEGALEHVKLLDFGIARTVASSQLLTRTGAILGTPGYMAPEQVRGEHVDARADVYALGCVLFECIAGRQPFAGAHVWTTLAKVLFEDAPRLRTVVPTVPEDIDDAVARLLAREPSARPRDGAEVVRLLGGIRTPLPPRSARTSWSQTSQSVISVTVTCLAARADGPMAAVPVDATGVASEAEGYTADNRVSAAPFGHEADDPAGVPEASRVRPRVAIDEIQDIASRHGGELAILSGGIVMILFSAKAAVTDVAVRATACGLALCTLIPWAPVAVATGRGVLAERPFGDVVDRAGYLLPEARPGTVRIDDVTADLLDGRFRLEQTAPGAFEVVASSAPPTTARLLLGRATPFVGRDRELLTLEAFFDECAAERRPQAVLLTGPAGIGKSRVRDEFIRRLRERGDACAVLVCRGDASSAGSPYFVAAQAVRHACDLGHGDPSDERRRLREAIERRVAGKDDRERVAEFLGEMLRIPSAGASVQLAAARQDPALMGQHIRRAWVDWLGAESARQRVVLVLEDLHWGDTPSVKLVDAALRDLADRPLLVLALARPEIHEVFRNLWTDRGSQEIRLGALSRRAAERLAADLLGPRADAHVVDLVVTRADGHPFFLEELLRGIAEGRTEIPETVLMGVQVRLAAFEEPILRVLRAASVFGEVFWSGAVKRLLGAEALHVDLWLRALVEGEVITRRLASRIPGETEFEFRHSLVRDAAYRLLTTEDIVHGHGMAAAWLEEANATEPLALADHWERGGEPLRAVPYFQRASEAALDGDDFAAAEAFAARAIVCGATGQRLGRLTWLRAEALNWLGDLAGAAQLVVQALGVLEIASDGWYGALTLACRIAGVTGDVARLHELAEMLGTAPPERSRPWALRAMAAMAFRLRWLGDREKAAPFEATVEAAGSPAELDPAVAADVLRVRAERALQRGDVGGYAILQEQVLLAHQRIGGQRAACFQSVNVGEALMVLGELAAAEHLLEATLRDSTRAGMRAVIAWSQQVLGNTLRYLGRSAEAVVVLARSVHEYHAIGERPMESLSLAWRSRAMLEAGDPAAAEIEARRAVELSEVSGFQVEPLCSLACALLACGRPAEALHAARRGAELAEKYGTGGSIDDSPIHLAFAEALAATGDQDAARTVIGRARAKLLGAAETMSSGRRRTFLEGVPPHARILTLAESWGAKA
jgi:tetratricopeptide (TPR) repeat protein